MIWKKGCFPLYQNGLKETEIAVECSVLDISFSFDVGRSMFDVRRSSFNVTSEPSHLINAGQLPL